MVLTHNLGRLELNQLCQKLSQIAHENHMVLNWETPSDMELIRKHSKATVGVENIESTRDTERTAAYCGTPNVELRTAPLTMNDFRWKAKSLMHLVDRRCWPGL
jgi:hypothetical protein